METTNTKRKLERREINTIANHLMNEEEAGFDAIWKLCEFFADSESMDAIDKSYKDLCYLELRNDMYERAYC